MAGPAEGRVPAIHVFLGGYADAFAWMAGAGHPARLRAGTPTSPAMTADKKTWYASARPQLRRFRPRPRRRGRLRSR
jgi:hypothetical protein